MSKQKWRYLLGGKETPSEKHAASERSRANSEPNILRAKVHARWIQNIEQKSKSTQKNSQDDKSPARGERCSCCKKRFNLLETLHRVNPPCYCVYCGREVCRNCHSNDSCHQCFTRERRDVRSVSKLEDMEREELIRIMKDLHCQKADFKIEDKSQMVMTILNLCNMDKSFISQYEEHLREKQNGENKDAQYKPDEIVGTSETNRDPIRCNQTIRDSSTDETQSTSEELGSSRDSLASTSKSGSEENVDQIARLRSMIAKGISTLTECQLAAILNVVQVMNDSK